MEDKVEESDGTHVIRIGNLLKQVLEKQKESIKEATYGVCKPSDLEAGEIIAKKVMGMA